MEKRTIERFKKQSILLHWVQSVSFVIMAVTGGLRLFHLVSFQGGYAVRVVHLVTSAVFVVIPLIYCLIYPTKAGDFVKETFHWDVNDLRWLRQAPRFYFGGKGNSLPPQDRINGDQKLWQTVIILTCLSLLITGIILWLFRMNIPVMAYQIILLIHGAAFVILFLGFLVHFYLTSFHPYFNESLSSMIDGKISVSYARKYYPKWYDKVTGKRPIPNVGGSKISSQFPQTVVVPQTVVGSVEETGKSDISGTKPAYISKGEVTSMPKYQCVPCGWIYDPEKGDPAGGIKPGTLFEQLPANWVCPVCGAAKDQFKKL